MITAGIFKANDIRGHVGGADAEWDAEGAYVLGAAFADALDLGPGDDGVVPGGVVLGRDMRVTSPELSAAFTEGLLLRGVDVIDIGLASTDGLWFASGRLDRPGVMFTASHNPGRDNGIKFCLAGARPIPAGLLPGLAERAMSGVAPEAAPTRGRRVEQDLLDDYAAHLHSLVDLSGIRRLRVVADAGNGMAGHTLPSVLGVLDLDLIGLYTDPDGTFPNHAPNPLEPENLVDAQRAVVEHGADLALVFDGDADRCFIIDETGAVVDPSVITAMIAVQELVREPGSTIVINTITSRAVAEVVAAHGGSTVVTKVGHTFVKQAMADHDAIFGGEHSAHYYFREFWRADTGMLAALHVLALVGRTEQALSELTTEFSRYHASGELNSTVPDAPAVMARVEAAYAGRGSPDRTDGLTVSGEDWWFNLRPSNTEPLLRLNVEAGAESTMQQVRDEVLGLVRS